eukprot:GGOE01001644.1.p1 GENE.GGOE01001644.1~~GGOE01001644.1.p1  ORF type:complete len:668 (+),score=205.48 GGOE01001644.1:98-2101(+)
MPRGGPSRPGQGGSSWALLLRIIILLGLVFLMGNYYRRLERVLQFVRDASVETVEAHGENLKHLLHRYERRDTQPPVDSEVQHAEHENALDAPDAPGEVELEHPEAQEASGAADSHTCTPGHCPFCGHEERTLWTMEGPHKLWKCNHCGFLYLWPMPAHPPNVTYPEGWVPSKVVANKQKVLDFFPPEELAAITGWLDVGAGNGELIKAVQQADSHLNVTGLETSPLKIRGAAQHGLTVVSRDLASIEEKFDVVSFMNVLSHVSCPISFYLALKRLLTPTGCLFMCTGNAADLQTATQNPSRSYSLPDHVVFGGLRHAVQLMEQAGLEVKRLQQYRHFWHNYAPFKKGPFRAIYLKACQPPGHAAPKLWTEERFQEVLRMEQTDEDAASQGSALPEGTLVLKLTAEEEEALVVHDQPAVGTDEKDVCPICGATEHTEFKREAGYSLGKCSRCGFLYLNPMPFGIDPDKKTYRENWEHPKVAAMQAKVLDFWPAAELAGLKNWLDVGAGNGELLMALRKSSQHLDALGIETTQYKIDHAVAKGLTVIKKRLEDFAPSSYDVVSAMNVLSHVARPVGFFGALARIVKPGGCIWMSTGNAADIPVNEAPGRFDLPDHLVFAGRRHVFTIFHRIGFKVQSYKEYKHFWHNYRALKPGRFRAVYVRACKPLT